MAGDERSHFESRLTVEVIAAEQTTIRSLLARLRARRAELNVYRGRTLSFSFSPHGRFSLDFLRLPALDRSQVILPEADLAAIEQHTLGIARHTAALRATGGTSSGSAALRAAGHGEDAVGDACAPRWRPPRS